MGRRGRAATAGTGAVGGVGVVIGLRAPGLPVRAKQEMGVSVLCMCCLIDQACL